MRHGTGVRGVETKKETDRQTDSLLLRYFCNVLFPLLHTQEFRQVERLFKGGSAHGKKKFTRSYLQAWYCTLCVLVIYNFESTRKGVN